MGKTERWNKDNLTNPKSEEFIYSDYIDLVEKKIDQIKNAFHQEINMETYYDIINNREKVKKIDKLQRVHKLLVEIEKILTVKDSEAL